MRTTLTIDADVLAAFKHEAAETHRTLSGLVEAALREHLARRRDAVATKPLEFPIVGGRGMAPGIDPAGNASLLGFVDAARDADAGPAAAASEADAGPGGRQP